MVAMILVGLCAGLYLRTLDYPMVFDDHAYLTQNPFWREEGVFLYPLKFREFVNRPAKLGSDPDFAVNIVMRPVAYASFRLNYFWDGFRPRWYRALNIAVHAVNAVLVYGVVSQILGCGVRRGLVRRSSVLFIASSAALLFVVHPLAVESVTYIVQRFTSLAAMFSLGALSLHFAALERGAGWARRLFRGGSVVAMLMAMQTKESSFMIPPMALLVDWLVYGSGLRCALRRSLPLLLCMPLIPTLVLATAACHHGELTLTGGLNLVNSRTEPVGQWEYLVTQCTVVAHYLRLIVWPAALNIDPDWPVFDSLLQPRVHLALVSLGSVVAAVWRVFRGAGGDPRGGLALVSTAWFFAVISVSSSVVPLPDMVAEHRSYLPSVGIFVLVACLLDRLRTEMLAEYGGDLLVSAAVVMSAGLLCGVTDEQNHFWRSNESLWKRTAELSPGKCRVWGNLGTAYSHEGRESAAVDCYRRALELQPRYTEARMNLANSLVRLGRTREALDAVEFLIRDQPGAARLVAVRYLRSLALAGEGRAEETVEILRRICAESPSHPHARDALRVVGEQARNRGVMRGPPVVVSEGSSPVTDRER